MAFCLGARRLDAKIVWVDEVATLRHTGAASYGPLSPFAIWERVGTHDPSQAPGYLLLQPRDRVWRAYMPDKVSTTQADLEAELIATFVECQPTLIERHVTSKPFTRSSNLCSL